MNSLQKRVGLASTLSILVFGVFILVYSFHREREYHIQSIHSEIRKSASFLVPQAYLILKKDDSTILLDYAQVLQSGVQKGNFLYVEIADADGRVKMPLDMLGKPARTGSLRGGPWAGLAVGQDYFIREEHYPDTGPVIEGVFGVVERDRILGYVILGVSTRPTIAALRKSTGATAALLLVVLIAAAYASWKFAQKATAPVLDLARAVETYSDSGDLKKFDIRGPREVELLAAKMKSAFETIGGHKLELKKTVEARTQSLLKTQDELKSVVDGFRRLSKSIRLDDATKVIVDIARSIVYCNVACAVLPVNEDGTLAPLDSENPPAPENGGLDFEVYPQSLLRNRMKTVSNRLVLDVLGKKETRVLANLKDASQRGEVHASIQSCALVPLISGEGKAFGILFLGMTGDAAFDENELQTLQKLMEPVGMAMDNVHLYSQVEKLATCDSMTGLLNHQNIRERLAESLKIARRQETPLYVLAADIDKFKRLNDTYGHPAGDQVIKAFANILKGSRRAGEFAGRPGGEEFLVVLNNTDLQGAERAAERILLETRGREVSAGDGIKIRFSVSLGIAGFPRDGLTLDELIDKADRALYVAKARGRDRFVVWSRGIDAEFLHLRNA